MTRKLNPMETVSVENLEKLSGKKYRVHWDNGEAWLLYASDLRALGITEDSVLGAEQYAKIRCEVIGKRAKKRAMHLLEQMDRTEQQLRGKLAEGEYPPDLLEEAIDYVKSYHYIDDRRYADSFVRLHGEGQSKGRLLMKLQKKGIDGELARNVLAEYEESRDEVQMIRELMEKCHYAPETADQGAQRRMYGYLARRGFQSSDIYAAMKR
jgi:regulatory protein